MFLIEDQNHVTHHVRLLLLETMTVIYTVLQHQMFVLFAAGFLDAQSSLSVQNCSL